MNLFHFQFSASSKLRQLTRQWLYQDTARVRNKALEELDEVQKQDEKRRGSMDAFMPE